MRANRFPVALAAAAAVLVACRSSLPPPERPAPPPPTEPNKPKAGGPGPDGAPEAAAAASAERDFAFFLTRLVDLDRLPVLEDGVRTAQFSSYDRRSRYDAATGTYVDWDANGDAGQYIRVEPSGEAVMAEMEGPGCIWRIWSANPTGRIRFYFDGTEAPSIDLDFAALFSGKIPPFVRPLVWQRRLERGGGNPASDSYVPIPFARKCKVTADKAHPQYYHIGYSTFPPDWKVKTFSPELDLHDSGVLRGVAMTLAGAGEDPLPLDDVDPDAKAERETSSFTLAPGQRNEFARIRGPATIRQLFAKARTAERWGRRKILLEIRWDGAEEPAVQAPIGDFFGDAWDESPYASLPLGIGEDLDYCYFRMPFAKSASLSVVNGGSKPADLKFVVVTKKGRLPPGTGYFHARWRRDRGSADFDYPFIDVTGRGRYVGVALFPHNIVGGWWGEGDEKAYVDGEKFPSTFGTGSEDFFGDAWGIRGFANAFHGCPTPEERPRQSCYRWQISDSIPFRESFRMTIENYAALRKEPGRNDYSSVAYWYAAPGARDFFASVRPEDCVPQGRAVTGAIEAEGAVAAGNLPPGASIVTDEGFPKEMSGGKAVKVEDPGDTAVAFDIPAPADGTYSIEVVPAPGPGPFPVEVVAGGNPGGDKVALKKGPNRIEVRLRRDAPAAGSPAVLIDCFLLFPYKNFVRRWWLLGPFPVSKSGALDTDFGPEKAPFDPAAVFDGAGGKLKWRAIHVPGGPVTSEGRWFSWNEELVLYARCEVEAPEARKATALVGSDDGVKVWVNGKLAFSHDESRPLVPDQDRFEVDLRKGRNEVLLKLEQGGGPWGFSLRFDDPEEAIRVVAPE